MGVGVLQFFAHLEPRYLVPDKAHQNVTKTPIQAVDDCSQRRRIRWNNHLLAQLSESMASFNPGWEVSGFSAFLPLSHVTPNDPILPYVLIT